MEPSFDYNQFKAQNQLHNALRAFAENLREATNATNVRNFPTVQGQPLPFEQLLRDLNIETQQAAVPDFDFEFIGVTLAAVEAHCLANNLNFMTFTQNRGNKLYYYYYYSLFTASLAYLQFFCDYICTIISGIFHFTGVRKKKNTIWDLVNDLGTAWCYQKRRAPLHPPPLV